ncbi:LOW QUALITY PROTEIN: hypothetical protein U9M48_012990 [Paspalum notatum var. saurae]|uniref:Uncharacterized protein n=1 Tax=Paspalum notatum var. saurae TaxID=547442 RepID=A0AAQ3SYJ8_PASNO
MGPRGRGPPRPPAATRGPPPLYTVARAPAVLLSALWPSSRAHTAACQRLFICGSRSSPSRTDPDRISYAKNPSQFSHRRPISRFASPAAAFFLLSRPSPSPSGHRLRRFHLRPKTKSRCESNPPVLGRRNRPLAPLHAHPPPPSALLCRRPSPLDCGRHRAPR